MDILNNSYQPLTSLQISEQFKYMDELARAKAKQEYDSAVNAIAHAVSYNLPTQLVDIIA